MKFKVLLTFLVISFLAIAACSDNTNNPENQDEYKQLVQGRWNGKLSKLSQQDNEIIYQMTLDLYENKISGISDISINGKEEKRLSISGELDYPKVVLNLKSSDYSFDFEGHFSVTSPKILIGQIKSTQFGERSISFNKQP